MQAYSHDLRARIVRAVEAGAPKAVVARRFSVSLSAVKAYVRRQQTAGSLAPAPVRSGRKAHIRPDQEPLLIAQLRAASDATLAEHVTRWATDQGVRLSVATMCRAIRRVGW